MSLLTAIVPTNNFFDHENNFLYLISSIDGLYEIDLILILDTANMHELRRAEEIQAAFPAINFKIITGEYRSPGLARNQGILAAETKWIVFWDFDDEPSPNQFIAMCKIGNSEKSDCVVANYTKFDLNKKISSYYELSAKDPISNICVNPGIWRMIFLREKILPIQFSSALMGEDQEFLLNFEIYKRKITFYRANVYKYIIGHKNQATQNSDNLKYLIPISKQTLKLLYKSQTHDFHYIAIFYVRQILTLMRSADPKTRLEAFGKLWKFFLLDKNYRKKIRVLKFIQGNRHGR